MGIYPQLNSTSKELEFHAIICIQQDGTSREAFNWIVAQFLTFHVEDKMKLWLVDIDKSGWPLKFHL